MSNIFKAAREQAFDQLKGRLKKPCKLLLHFSEPSASLLHRKIGQQPLNKFIITGKAFHILGLTQIKGYFLVMLDAQIKQTNCVKALANKTALYISLQ